MIHANFRAYYAYFQSVQNCILCSASFLAEISVRSPQQIFVFIISKKSFLDQSIQKRFYLILKKVALILWCENVRSNFWVLRQGFVRVSTPSTTGAGGGGLPGGGGEGGGGGEAWRGGGGELCGGGDTASPPGLSQPPSHTLKLSNLYIMRYHQWCSPVCTVFSTYTYAYIDSQVVLGVAYVHVDAVLL